MQPRHYTGISDQPHTHCPLQSQRKNPLDRNLRAHPGTHRLVHNAGGFDLSPSTHTVNTTCFAIKDFEFCPHSVLYGKGRKGGVVAPRHAVKIAQ
jgi:hypothetical protein